MKNDGPTTPPSGRSRDNPTAADRPATWWARDRHDRPVVEHGGRPETGAHGRALRTLLSIHFARWGSHISIRVVGPVRLPGLVSAARLLADARPDCISGTGLRPVGARAVRDETWRGAWRGQGVESARLAVLPGRLRASVVTRRLSARDPYTGRCGPRGRQLESLGLETVVPRELPRGLQCNFSLCGSLRELVAEEFASGDPQGAGVDTAAVAVHHLWGCAGRALVEAEFG